MLLFPPVDCYYFWFELKKKANHKSLQHLDLLPAAAAAAGLYLYPGLTGKVSPLQ